VKKLNNIILFFLLCSNTIFAFELDKKVKLDEDGFWGAHYNIPQYVTIGILAAAAYEGTESRFGKTSWQSLDAGLMSQILAEGFKRATGKLRPRESDSNTILCC